MREYLAGSFIVLMLAVGDTLVIYPHDLCPVDGLVIEGHGEMDESHLTVATS